MNPRLRVAVAAVPEPSPWESRLPNGPTFLTPADHQGILGHLLPFET